jgi:hypothetical protein
MPAFVVLMTRAAVVAAAIWVAGYLVPWRFQRRA